MSGNVVAWVFARFPTNSEVDRNRKIILSEVAESANRDFADAHPGIQSIVDHWGFGRSTVVAHLRWLVENGWLEVTEQGRGRGHATVYRVIRERVQDLDPSSRKGPDGDREKVQMEPHAPTSLTCSNSPEDLRDAHASHPDSLPGIPPSKARELPPYTEEANAIAKRVFANRKPKPIARWLNVRDLARRALVAGRDESEVERLMMDPATVFTVNGWQVAEANAARGQHEETTQERVERIRASMGVE